MDCQSGRSWEQHSVCGDDPSIQQSSHAAVYTLLHNFTFTLLSTQVHAFISTTSTVTILCTCPIMHDKLNTYCCLHLFTESENPLAHAHP